MSASDDVQLWYHTLDLPGIGSTPGWFDLRPLLAELPWPAVEGRRCLDVATYDGFYAFELERRGAAAVTATDIADHADWDWPLLLRDRGGPDVAKLAGTKGLGYEIAHAALGSSVEKVITNVYDLSPERVGRFDVVVCGSLLLHLRDPVRALEAIRSVCDGVFLSIEAVSLPLTVLHPRRPAAEIGRTDEIMQWWTVNRAGHRRLLEASGFEVLQHTRPFAIPFGVAHPPRGGRLPDTVRRVARTAAMRGRDGVAHVAALARPVS